MALLLKRERPWNHPQGLLRPRPVLCYTFGALPFHLLK